MYILSDNQRQKIIKKYSEKKALYSEFASLIRNLLEGFLRSEGFKFQILNRSKEKEKLVEKIERKAKDGKEYKFLEDIEDLAGVGIVFYLEDDKKKFLERFSEEFEGCISKAEEKYDPQGYRGKHFIFRLNNERASLVEYKKYAGLKCEIQVSTILFHAWSEVEHDIIYKPTGDKDLLQSLGLNDLKQSFEKVMVEHLQTATHQLDYLNKKYKSLSKAGKVFGSDFLTDISISKNNDNIYEILEVISEFYHKKPEETIAIVNAVIGKKPLSPVLLHNFGGHRLYGKTRKDLVLKCLDLLSNIRYFKSNEVLKTLADLSLNTDQEISSKALDITKKCVKYDYSYMTQVKNYAPQRIALDFVKTWFQQDQLKHSKFVEVILKELLSPLIEGTTSGLNNQAQYTITMHSGVVSLTDFLKKMRREVIDLVYKLYKTTGDVNLKLKLVGIFDEASRTPDNILYGDDIVQMIIDDFKYITGIYRKIIFGETGNKMIDHLGIVATIEERLYWINRSEKRKVEESEKLREDILRDELYNLYRLLVGDPVTYQEEEGWDTSEKIRNEEINGITDSIKSKQVNEWFDKLNKIASQHILIDEWKFNPFKGFIRTLSEKKPQIADDILKKAFSNNSPLKHFTSSFLDGFRFGIHFDLWDKYTEEIVESKDIEQVTAIVFSLNIFGEVDLKKFIREKDIALLVEITKQEGRFAFLKKETDDRVLQYALFNTLARNFARSPKQIESLLVEEIQNHPKYLNIFFSELSMATHRKWIDVKKLSKETIEIIKQQIVELPDIDWHSQGLLFEIGEKHGLESVLVVFMARIQKDAKRKEKEGRRITDERYDAIPYHFNPELSKFIVEHPDYIKLAGEWVSKMTTDWSIYNWHVSHLFQRLGKGFDEIIAELIQKGDDDSLLKAARVMHSIKGTNFELCVDIVRKTDNKRVLSQVDSNMYTTGVVLGEYGIAEAYENKAKILEKYKEDDSDRVRKFTKRMIESFLDSAKRERQCTDKEKQLRKIEFEG